MTLGERIALARKKAGLSQEQLGDRLGVSRQAVSKWESSQANPDVAYVAELCRIYGVSCDWLLLGGGGGPGGAPRPVRELRGHRHRPGPVLPPVRTPPPKGGGGHLLPGAGGPPQKSHRRL